MNKKQIREEVRLRKLRFSKSELFSMSENICKSIINDGLWRASTNVLLYNSLADEVDTQLLIKNAELYQKNILLPVVEGENLVLKVYSDKNSLKIGAFGILEPTGKIFEECDYHKINLAIIPGMAFDKQKNRLGRGKGFYDRLLPKLTNAYKIGVCFPFQLLENIPNEEHDIKMNEVVC
ncbi:MAG: 5-formyltetrahydrofolate cyclo-ligase [Bacteroidales bacterium]|nr:5-formyltetrahydrofolate cyclo-ligase [Bacteroidales bacterium]